MMDLYIYKGTEKLRCGYTTGSCAAGAAGAAAQMLLTGSIMKEITIITPKQIKLSLEITNQNLREQSASCAVIKDSGDDPDITNGTAIFAEVRLQADDITITGGEGVGIVTKPGLDQPVGAYAINSVPRQMIAETLRNIAEAYDYHGGFSVKIFVPGGRELAKKTYNPRMGIEGGISIIGTTGIVEPMSNSALIETIRTEANMRKAQGRKILILTIGNYSEQFVRMQMPFSTDCTVTCSNFIGEAIDIGLSLEFQGIFIIGHVGKLVKLGAGIMNTHSAQADGRMDVLVTCGVMAGADLPTLRKLPDCVTVDAAFEILHQAGYLHQTCEYLVRKIDYYLTNKVKETVPIGAMLFSNQHDLLLKTRQTDELLTKIREENLG